MCQKARKSHVHGATARAQSLNRVVQTPGFARRLAECSEFDLARFQKSVTLLLGVVRADEIKKMILGIVGARPNFVKIGGVVGFRRISISGYSWLISERKAGLIVPVSKGRVETGGTRDYAVRYVEGRHGRVALVNRPPSSMSLPLQERHGRLLQREEL